MARTAPLTPRTRIAAIDIDLGACRMLVADHLPQDLFDGERLEWLDRRVAVTGLATSAEPAGLTAAAVGRSVAVLAGFGAAVRSWDVDRIAAAASPTIGRADGVEEFLERVAATIRARPVVLAVGAAQTLWFRGACSGVDVAGPGLVVDIGPVSTMLMAGGDSPAWGRRLSVGAMTVVEQHLSKRPARSDELRAAREAIDGAIGGVELDRPPGTAIGSGGYFAAMAATVAGLPVHDLTRLHGMALDVDTIAGLVGRLAILTSRETETLGNAAAGSAPYVLGAALIAERLVHHLAIGEVVVSVTDLLDGLALAAAST